MTAVWSHVRVIVVGVQDPLPLHVTGGALGLYADEAYLFCFGGVGHLQDFCVAKFIVGLFQVEGRKCL